MLTFRIARETAMWKPLQAAVMILLMSAAATSAQKPLKADDILKGAKLKAADQNKVIFVIFGASWCDACHQLDSFLTLPEVAAIFDKYFVIAELTFGEGAAGHPDWDNPGADTLVLKYGGLSPGGDVSRPFIAILAPKAKLIVHSSPPEKAKAGSPAGGFPIEPAEIKSFLAMLQKAAPSMTDEEMHKIQDGLRKAVTE